MIKFYRQNKTLFSSFCGRSRCLMYAARTCIIRINLNASGCSWKLTKSTAGPILEIITSKTRSRAVFQSYFLTQLRGSGVNLIFPLLSRHNKYYYVWKRTERDVTHQFGQINKSCNSWKICRVLTIARFLHRNEKMEWRRSDYMRGF